MKRGVQRVHKLIRGMPRYLARAGLLVTAFLLSGSMQLLGIGVARAQSPELSALATAGYNVTVSPETTSMDSSVVQHGYRNWMSIINNNLQTDATNASISYMSGYSPTLFDSVSSFPYTTNFGTLPAGSMQTAKLMPNDDSAIPVDYTLGYDSTKTTDITSIPVGGGQQTVTITITPKDSRYIPSSDSNISFHLFVYADLSIPGVTVASTTNPNNLNQGEEVQVTTDDNIVHWQFGAPQVNKTYTFTATLNVPNDTGAPFDFQPIVQLDGQRHTDLSTEQVGSSVTIVDPTLDGDTAGSGAVTFSTDGTHTWRSTNGDIYAIVYQGTQREEQQPLEVPILIKPGSPQPPAINPKSHGILPVAILSTGSFDATTVDRSTVSFGPMGPTRATPLWSINLDVNRDRKPDMLLFFKTQDAGFGCEAPNAGIQGQTRSGQQIHGNSPIRIVGCRH